MSGSLCGPALYAGVDGCRAGWIAVLQGAEPGKPEIGIFDRFCDLVGALDPNAIIAVDMPIGLPERIEGAGRGPEQAVRPFLGARQSSVFSIPSRSAVEAATYGEACARALATSNPPKKVSKQAFNLFPKILEIDAMLQRDRALRDRVIECHPEFSFCQLNGGVAMGTPKKIKGKVNDAGIAERLALLERAGLERDSFNQGPPRGASMDDFVDAAVNLVMARRFAAGLLSPFPAEPLRDRHGIQIAIFG